MCYASAGVFIARLVDRANRVKLIAVCVAIWAVSTALCGFARSFAELLAARAGTAIAEAALSPAALSIFSDIFPPRKVTRASSVFMLGPYIGGGLALFALRHGRRCGRVAYLARFHAVAGGVRAGGRAGSPAGGARCDDGARARATRNRYRVRRRNAAFAARSARRAVRAQSLLRAVFRGVCRIDHAV